MTATWFTPWHGLQATAVWRYYSGVTLTALSPNPYLGQLDSGATIANGKISNTDARISSFSYLDLTAAMPFGDKVNVRVGVDNLLDKQPPVIGVQDISGSSNGNTYPMYDTLGRYIFGNITVTF